MSFVESFLAFRYLRAKRQEGFVSVITWFSLLGIMLGVATLIIVMSVMNGFRAELFGRVIGLNGHVALASSGGGPLADYDALVQKILPLSGVVAAMPTVEAQALLSTGAHASGVMVRGIRAEDLAQRPVIRENIQDGDLAAFTGDSIMIGARLAQKIGKGVGDSLTLISPRGSPTVFGMSPRLKSYRIAAVFNVGMYEYDMNVVFLPLETAQMFFRLGEYATGIDVLVENPENPARVRRDIQFALGEDVRASDWQQTNSSFFTALQVERNVMFLILTLIIVVAAFNIISSMIMLVRDKGRDIAILRTMGAPRDTIMNVFFIAGASIGVVGTILGLGLGVMVANNIETIRQALQQLSGTDLFSAEIYFLSKLPAKIDWSEVWQVTSLSIALSFGATLYPSWRAARMDPVEALRYE